jgi:heme/copper-type cytochrome/quinol oxidase subunit 1
MGSLCFGISGTCISLILRNEIDASTNRIISLANFNIYLLSITAHGLLMIFFLVMPALIGAYGNYLVPIS